MIKELEAKGWTYQDFNKMRAEYWRYLLKGFGEEGEDKDYVKLSEAYYEEDDGPYMRGQLMLSPQSRKNLGEYIKTNPIPGAAVQ